MKIDFILPTDKGEHEYCIYCHKESVQKVAGNKHEFICESCGKTALRTIVIKADVVWWVDPETKDYWHESVGMLLRNRKKELLIFKRETFPLLYGPPAGHMDAGEDAKTGALRELQEETGIVLKDARLFSEEDVAGDSCLRGSDHHRWHLFVGDAPDDVAISMNHEEGSAAEWISLDKLQGKEIVYPLKYFIEKYGDRLLQ